MATFINTGGELPSLTNAGSGEIPNLRLLALTRAGGRGTMSNDPRLNRPALLTEPVPQTEEQQRLAREYAKQAANKRYDGPDRGNAKNSRIAPPSRNETSSTTSETLTDTGTTNSTNPNKLDRRTWNPLSEFSSVTYKLSLYAMTPEAFNNYNITGNWQIKDLELIVQSGGITAGLDSPRNSWFNYDFTIDDLEIVGKINAKETTTATNNTGFKFKIYEPYGMTFPTRLVKAEIELQQKSKIKKDISQQIEALNTPFLLVIRFYGYDSNGEVASRSINNTSATFTKTDEVAAFERAFPIVITKFNFRLDNKVTVYNVEAKAINEQIGFGLKRGITQSPIEIQADTVKSAIEDLFKKITKQQNEITNAKSTEKKQQVADSYSVYFNDSAIGNATIVEKDSYVKSRAPIAKVNNAGGSNVRKSQQASTVEKNERLIQINSGTPILTAIDQIISQSTYIRDAMKILEKENVETVLDNVQDFEEKSARPLSWWNITPQVSIVGEDSIRNDYAYKINYVIQKYQVPYVRSLVTGTNSPYTGASKIYDYFYTGKNSEILKYEQQYNLLYFNTAALMSAAANANIKDGAPNKAVPGQSADATGKLPGTFEFENNIKAFLYSPADQLKAQIQILGDPDYLMPSSSGPVALITKQFYGDDFAINPNSGQVFIELDFKQVEDYNTTYSDSGDQNYSESGLLNPSSNILFWDYPEPIKSQSNGRMIYMILEVISRFSNGTFTQDLKTILPNFPSAASTPVVKTQNDQRESYKKTRVTNNRPSLLTKPVPQTEEQLRLAGEYAKQNKPATTNTASPNDDQTNSMITGSEAAFVNTPMQDDTRETNKTRILGRGAARIYDTSNTTRSVVPRGR